MTPSTSRGATTPQSSPQTWSVIVLCYNEAGTIRQVVADVKALLNEIAPSRHEIIIVDDGSNDDSTQTICDIRDTVPNVKAVFHSSNLGIGSALRTGYSHAQNENVCAVPGDGQFDVSELRPFRAVPERTFISFYRLENTTYSRFRNGLSYLNKLVNRLALGINIKDVNWVKVYKTSELRKLTLCLASSLIQSEICAKLILRQNTVLEVRSTYLPRTYGKSKGGSLKIASQAAVETLRLIVEVRKSARLSGHSRTRSPES
jgi:glycosyltransferase involved in cell wall biosynthesis